MDHLFILAKAQIMWGIPVDSALPKPQLQQLMTEVQRISEQWGDSNSGVLEVDDYGVMRVKTTIALIGRALLAGLSYFHTRYEPESYVDEARALWDGVTDLAPPLMDPQRQQTL